MRKFLSAAAVVAVLFAAGAHATGIPVVDTREIMGEWAEKTLKGLGIEDAYIVSMGMPVWINFCRSGSMSLERWTIADASGVELVEANSEYCKPGLAHFTRGQKIFAFVGIGALSLSVIYLAWRQRRRSALSARNGEGA